MRIALAVRLGTELPSHMVCRFGLAYVVIRNSTKQSPSDVMFGPARRGYHLLSVLNKAEASMNARRQRRADA
jgi:hypothetical protein